MVCASGVKIKDTIVTWHREVINKLCGITLWQVSDVIDTIINITFIMCHKHIVLLASDVIDTIINITFLCHVS